MFIERDITLCSRIYILCQELRAAVNHGVILETESCYIIYIFILFDVMS